MNLTNQLILIANLSLKVLKYEEYNITLKN